MEIGHLKPTNDICQPGAPGMAAAAAAPPAPELKSMLPSPCAPGELDFPMRCRVQYDDKLHGMVKTAHPSVTLEGDIINIAADFMPWWDGQYMVRCCLYACKAVASCQLSFLLVPINRPSQGHHNQHSHHCSLHWPECLLPDLPLLGNKTHNRPSAVL